MKQATSIEEYITSCGQWETSLRILRAIMLSSGLEETIKWGGPVYVAHGKNATGMAAFKSYVGIWFYQGALLADAGKKLICAQEGVTKALRQWRFSSPEEIVAEKELIRAYIDETISNIREGKEIKPEKNATLVIPAELGALLDEDPLFRDKFAELSLTNRRDYARYISEAKQEKTRLARLEKIVPMILQGIGMNDKYK